MPETVKTVVTQRDNSAGVSETVTANTPAGEPNVTAIAMPWWQQVLIRVARVYVQGLIGFLGASVVGALNLGDFSHAFISAAQLSVAPAVVTLLMNAGEILSKLDTTNYARFRA